MQSKLQSATPEYIELGSLKIDHRYQRKLDSRPTAMAADWSPWLAGAIEVSARTNGKYVVVSGQHRVEAMRLLADKREPILCLVHRGLTVAQEAWIFHMQPDTAKGIMPLARHKAKLVSGSPFARQLEDAAALHGFTIDDNKTSTSITAVKALEYVYDLDPVSLDRALEFLSWWGDKKPPNQLIIKGLGMFFTRFAPIESQRLLRKLGTKEHIDVLNAARHSRHGRSTSSGDGAAMAVAKELAQQYNRGYEQPYAAYKKPARHKTAA